MDFTDDIKFNNNYAKVARYNAQAQLEQLHNVMQNLAGEALNYVVRFQEAKNDKEREHCLSSAIHHFSVNMHANLRLDILADKLAELRISRTMERELERFQGEAHAEKAGEELSS